MLHGKAIDVFKLIKSNKVRGPIVDQFLTIQRNEGEIAAFEFLAVEADGFHTTPYGHCVNSFTVDPCPKHLEYFNGCLHLTRSEIEEHTNNLIELSKRFIIQLESIDKHPASVGAKQNMSMDVNGKLDAIQKILNTSVGDKVFSDGKDLSSLTLTQSKDLFKNAES